MCEGVWTGPCCLYGTTVLGAHLLLLLLLFLAVQFVGS